jgi:uncharacterized protein YdeI (YjbR/CyaY-like superfamily)
MPTIDTRIDSYIAKSADFTKPILKHLRKLVHQGCPEVVETIKWSFVSFDYKGPFCSMAAFKEHCVFGFWKYPLLYDPKNYLGERKNKGGEAMGNLGRIISINDLPPDKAILDFIKQAKKLNDDGVKLPQKSKKEKVELIIPDYLTTALSKNKKAKTTFEGFSYSNKKEYIEWLTEAKTGETRNKRLAMAVEWMSEGKVRNWKYVRK